MGYHEKEVIRLQSELDCLDDSFAEDGIVKTVLRNRISNEKELSRKQGLAAASNRNVSTV